jgi:glycosyltransferase involved in cell wall biosynthesis
MTQPIERDKPALVAIIPAYNEALRIEFVIIETLKHLPVLVVDDGSDDDTSQVSEQKGADVLLQKPNQGKGAALKAGFKRAIEQGFEAVVTLDADGQHDPAEIPKFIQSYEDTGADLIIGARDFSEMPLVRRIANGLGRHSFSWAMGETILDNQSGYRLISRRLMQDLTEIEQEGFEFEVEMIVSCVQHGYDLEWVEIRTIYAGESSHINPIKHLINYISLVLSTRRSIKASMKR